MTFTSPPNALASQSLAERKAQYAAWKDRIMSRDEDEVIVLADEGPGKWSVEALFAGLPVD